MLSSTYFVDTTPFSFPGLPLIFISWNDSRPPEEPPTGVVGRLCDSSFFLASKVALFSHCDSTPAPSPGPSSGLISGRSSGTLAELISLLRKCRRWDNRFVLGESCLDFWLIREEPDTLDATDVLRGRDLNNFPVLDSAFSSPGNGSFSSP